MRPNKPWGTGSSNKQGVALWPSASWGQDQDMAGSIAQASRGLVRRPMVPGAWRMEAW